MGGGAQTKAGQKSQKPLTVSISCGILFVAPNIIYVSPQEWRVSDDPNTDENRQSPRNALDLAIDQAAAAVAGKLREVLATSGFGLVQVEVRNRSIYVGGGSTVRIQPSE